MVLGFIFFNFSNKHDQKTTFQGLSLQDAKRVAFNSLIAESIGSVRSVEKRGLEITARTAGAAKNIEVEVDKPLGLTLGQKSGGGVVITVSIKSTKFLTVLTWCSYFVTTNFDSGCGKWWECCKSRTEGWRPGNLHQQLLWG